MSLTNPQNLTQNLQRLLQITSTGYRAISHEIVTLSGAGVYTLTVPEDANYALMVLEETGGTGTAKIARFWEDGSAPTTTEGLARGDMDAWDVISRSNLKDFKIIRVTAAAHKLFVQYYT